MKKIHVILVLLFIAIFCNVNNSNCQSTSTGNLISGFPNKPFSTSPLDYLGWDNTVFYPLEIRTNAIGLNAQPIYVLTSNTPRAIITSLGLFGIGDYTSWIPGHLLDVKGGDINVNDALNTGTTGYMIQGNHVLWHNGNITCIYTGVGAGFSSSTGNFNTFNGNNAGYSNTTGSGNTPKVKPEVADGELAVNAIGSGIMLNAPNGNNYYPITVDNTSKLIIKF